MTIFVQMTMMMTAKKMMTTMMKTWTEFVMLDFSVQIRMMTTIMTFLCFDQTDNDTFLFT